MVILIVVSILCLIIWAMGAGIHRGRIFAAQKAEFTAAHQNWDTHASIHNDGIISINREGNRVVLGKITAWKEYSFSDVASVEVQRDGTTITSTNRGSQAAGALLGGFAFGGVGLLLGGLSGSQTHAATLHSICIKVVVDDRTSPVHVVQFFKSLSSKGTPVRSALIKRSLEAADHFHALLVTAIRSQKDADASSAKLNTTDELKKLWDLRQAGALTDEEFFAQKTRILSGTVSAAQIGRTSPL